MKLVTALILALALPACATSFRAGDGDGGDGGSGDSGGFGREGAYVAGGLVKGLERFDENRAGLSSDNSDIGFAVRGGLRDENGVSLEASAERVTAYTIESGTARADLDISSLSLAVKYHFTDGRFQPYLMAGVGWAWAGTRAAGYDADAPFGRIGLGTDLYLTSNLAFFAEGNYNRMTGDLNDLDHVNLMLGIVIRF